MSDNPIFDSLEVKKDKPKTPWIFTLKGRKYVYGIATAGLAVLGIYFGVDAATQEQWLNLALAVLNLGGAGATALAGRNVR